MNAIYRDLDRETPVSLYILRHLHDQMKQYRAYAEDMRAIGRGMTPSSPFSPEMLIAILEDAIKAAR